MVEEAVGPGFLRASFSSVGDCGEGIFRLRFWRWAEKCGKIKPTHFIVWVDISYYTGVKIDGAAVWWEGGGLEI